MRRFLALFLLLAFTAFSSGALLHIHNLHHAYEDAQQDAAAHHEGKPLPHHPLHTQDNCPTHAQFAAPLLDHSAPPLPVLLGLWIPFLTELPACIVEHDLPSSLGCRGPPQA